MNERKALDFYSLSNVIHQRLRKGGVFATVINSDGEENVLTLGWGLIGPSYYDHPVFSIAVTPLRYSWKFLESVPEFVIALPDDDLAPALELCGTRSGKLMDKFEAAGLTRVPSKHVKPPSLKECPVNIECRIFGRVHPPHEILTPTHREQPTNLQHTIYFSEVLGAFAWE